MGGYRKIDIRRMRASNNKYRIVTVDLREERLMTLTGRQMGRWLGVKETRWERPLVEREREGGPVGLCDCGKVDYWKMVTSEKGY